MQKYRDHPATATQHHNYVGRLPDMVYDMVSAALDSTTVASNVSSRSSCQELCSRPGVHWPSRAYVAFPAGILSPDWTVAAARPIGRQYARGKRNVLGQWTVGPANLETQPFVAIQ